MTPFVRRLRHAALLLALVLICWLALLSPVGQRLEASLGLRALYALRGALPPPHDIVVVPLDQGVANTLGEGLDVERWPRRLHACLLDRLTRAGAALVVFDVFFAPDLREEPAPALAPWVDGACPAATGVSGTVALASAMRAAGKVLIASQIGEAAVDEAGAARLRWESQPDPLLLGAALGASAFPLPDDARDVLRFWTFLPALNPAEPPLPTLPVLALAALESPTPAPLRAHVAAARTGGAGADAALGRVLAGVDSALFKIYGPPGALTRLDYAEVLAARAGTALERAVRGKVVFVGASELSRNLRVDSFDTPYPAPAGRHYGGVELIATAFANLRDDTGLRSPGALTLLCLLALPAALFAAMAERLSPARTLALASTLAAAWCGVAWLAFRGAGWWLPLAVPLLLYLLLALGLALRGWRRAQQLAEIARRYVSLRAPCAPGSVVRGTVLASDARNFTSLGERLGDASLFRLLDGYYAALTAQVARASPPGTVLDLAGDGMLAMWGETPLDQPAERLAACRAALAIDAAVLAFNTAHPLTPLPTHIGLHAGTLALGDLPGGDRRFFKAVGDVINTASRVEGLNRLLGTRVLASADAVAGLDEALLLRPCGRFRLKGRTAGLSVVEICGETSEAAATPLHAGFVQALTAFERAEWGAAAQAFARLLTAFPEDGPTRFYAELAARYRQSPPSGEDPALIRMDEK